MRIYRLSTYCCEFFAVLYCKWALLTALCAPQGGTTRNSTSGPECGAARAGNQTLADALLIGHVRPGLLPALLYAGGHAQQAA